MIKLEHISKTFGDTGDGVHAVKDVSLEIGDGEIFGIIGFSGAGKSTLVRCINLLEQPTSGSITVNGQKLTWMEKQADGTSCMRTVSPQELRQARKKISMIFQGFNLLMQRTCLKNVCFPMELSGVPKAQAEKKALELLDLVGLKEKASAYPAQLSGGQKQRVAIARALATDPKVLLCDEATSALDPTTTNSILALLKELNQKLGVTVVIITHQMSVIEEICTRVAILDGGEVAEEGRVEDIFAHPATDAARRLVYPGGVSAKQYPAGTRAVRVSFNGGTVYDPLIASLAIDCGHDFRCRHTYHRRQGLRHHAPAFAGRSKRGRQGPELYPFPTQYHRGGGGVSCLRSFLHFGRNTAASCSPAPGIRW